MSKLIIFGENAVETLTYFSRQLAQAFESWGYEIFWLDFAAAQLRAGNLKQAVSGKNAVFLTFNCIGLSGEEELWEPDEAGRPRANIWDSLGIRCLNILVDHPLYYYKPLRHPVSDMRVFCIDKDHAAYMKRFYPDIRCEFLPTAGNLSKKQSRAAPDHGFAAGPDQAVQEDRKQWLKRPYPVVFTANYVPPANIEKQLERLEPEYRDFYYEIIEAFIQDPGQELLSCIEGFLKREIPDMNDAQLCKVMHTMAAVDLWVRTYYRAKTVRTLAEGGIVVHLFGKDWEKMDCGRKENLICSGRMIDSAGCVQAMAQSHLALNTMPWFKNGSHDRIFTAMLQGAAALTDDSIYLREQFKDLETILYYDLNNLEGLPDLVRNLLRQPDRIYEISRRGKEAAYRQHTWQHRAQMLQNYI